MVEVMPTRYKKPPIVEAVVGVHLAQPLDRKELEAVRAEFRDSHPNSDERRNLLFTAQPGASSVNEEFDGFILRTNTALESIVAGAQDFSTTCLAPYPGWDEFSAQAIKNYQRYRQLLGYRKMERVGVRFVNRIDIPRDPPDIEILLSEYFTISPDNLTISTENTDLKYSGYSIAVMINYHLPIKILLQTAIVPPALVNHMSVVLDIDAFVAEEAVPQTEDGLRHMLTRLRHAKNDIFERSITESSRKMFGIEST